MHSNIITVISSVPTCAVSMHYQLKDSSYLMFRWTNKIKIAKETELTKSMGLPILPLNTGSW